MGVGGVVICCHGRVVKPSSLVKVKSGASRSIPADCSFKVIVNCHILSDCTLQSEGHYLWFEGHQSSFLPAVVFWRT